MSNTFTSIGIVAAGKRDIRSGNEYTRFFPDAAGNDEVVYDNGNIDDTMQAMGKVIAQYNSDVKDLANKLLDKKSIVNTCKNNWDFVFNHIQYKLDKQGVEQLRRPARTWKERSIGVDCDCMTIFIVSLLVNQMPYLSKIDPTVDIRVRITKYNGKSHFQHVYPVLYYNNGNSHCVMDAVLNSFNYEKQFSEEKSFNMEQLGIPIHVLHGIEENANYDLDMLLSGIGNTSNEKEHLEKIYKYLQDTRTFVATNQAAVASFDNPTELIKSIDYALKHFWISKAHREKAFENLAFMEAKINAKHNLEVDDELDDDFYSFDGLGELDGLGSYQEDEMGALFNKKKRAERRAKRKVKKAARKEERQEKKAARKEERQNAKGFFRKVGVCLKQGTNAVVRYNPATIAMRNGFLAALRVNLFKMAWKIKWGYASRENALKHISAKRYDASRRALIKVQDFFVNKLQGTKTSLKAAILSGKQDNIAGTLGQLGAEPVETALIASAMPVITAALTMIGKEMNAVDKEEGVLTVEEEEAEANAKGLKKLFQGAQNLVGKFKNSKAGQIVKNTMLPPANATNATKHQSFEIDDEKDDSLKKDNKINNTKETLNNIKEFALANPVITFALIGGVGYAAYSIINRNKPKPRTTAKNEENLGIINLK